MQQSRWVVMGALACVLVACGGGSSVKRTGPLVRVDPGVANETIKQDFKQIEAYVKTFAERYERLPERLPELRDTPDEVPIMETLMRDPWRVPYVLRRIDRDVIITSAGPDLIIGSKDDQAMRIRFDAVAKESSR